MLGLYNLDSFLMPRGQKGEKLENWGILRQIGWENWGNYLNNTCKNLLSLRMKGKRLQISVSFGLSRLREIAIFSFSCINHWVTHLQGWRCHWSTCLKINTAFHGKTKFILQGACSHGNDTSKLKKTLFSLMKLFIAWFT